jgi:hypothetical protein
MKTIINFMLAIALMCIVLFAVFTVIIFPPLLILYVFIYGIFDTFGKLNSKDE